LRLVMLQDLAWDDCSFVGTLDLDEIAI
jgi:hypothetical protein